MTEPDPQLEELAEQRAMLRAAYAEFDLVDEFAGVNQHLDQLIAGLEDIGRELDDALARLDDAEQVDDPISELPS
ncbi:hypothetical protein [Nocardia sp. JMUB6875]|uniref:hypothetical protein n=1 Tax=Nocardia sp. JMUB6875 TaxID=3158170 RepID=UPI0034E84D2E